MLRVFRYGKNAFAVGLQWSGVNGAKAANELALELVQKELVAHEASVSSESGHDRVLGASYVMTGGDSVFSCGIGLIEKGDLAGLKTRSIYSLAAALCAIVENDGLYLIPLEAFGAGSGYWLLGITNKVVLPQTDVVFDSLDDLDANVSMIRELMPGLPMYVHPAIGATFLYDQQSWSPPDTIPVKGIKRIRLHGKAGNASVLLGKVTAAAVALAVLSGVGYYAWDYWKSMQPDPEAQRRLAEQQRREYDEKVRSLLAAYNKTNVLKAWHHARLVAAKAMIPQSGYEPVSLTCSANSCTISYRAKDFVPFSGGLADAFSSLGEVQQTSSNGAGGADSEVMIVVTRKPDALDSGNTGEQTQPEPDVGKLPDVNEITKRVTAESLGIRARLNNMYRLTSSSGAVVDSTQNEPPDMPKVVVSMYSWEADPTLLGFFEQVLAPKLGGTPSSLKLDFDEAGLPKRAEIGVLFLHKQ